MPLASKSRSYKDEPSCRSRALSWLCLIEHINERLGSYLENVVVPFLNYSFGFNSAPAIDGRIHQPYAIQFNSTTHSIFFSSLSAFSFIFYRVKCQLASFLQARTRFPITHSDWLRELAFIRIQWKHDLFAT